MVEELQWNGTCSWQECETVDSERVATLALSVVSE